MAFRTAKGGFCEEISMNNNVAMIDRVIRFVVGAALIALAWYGPGAGYGGWTLVGWIGVVPLLTSLVGWCPIYAMLGMSTCPRSPAH
jgi:hypothetical protein